MRRSTILNAVALCPVFATAIPATCNPAPYSVKLPPMRFEQKPAITVLVAAAQRARICFSVEGTAELHGNVSLSTADLNFAQLVARVAPQMQIQSDRNILNLRKSEGQKESWLDIPVTLDIQKPEDINMITELNLATELYLSARPGGKSPIFVGSILSNGAVTVGPYPKQTHSVRDWLNRLVQDGGGGFWVTEKRWLKRDGPPPLNVWKILLYSNPADFNQTQALTP